MSTATANFWAGGLASNMYWIPALREQPFFFLSPLAMLIKAFDNVKNRIMSEIQ